MAYYRQLGTVPPKRHTQHRDPDGHLYYEELMGEEGFSSDSSLLYHRGVPSAIVGSEVWELPDQTRTPNHPLKPRHLKLHTLFEDGATADAVTGRRLILANSDVRIAYVVTGTDPSPYYRNAIGDECVYVESGSGTVETLFGVLVLPGRRLRADPAGDHAPLGAGRVEPALPDRGEQPHRPAQALPLALRAAARARAVLRARPLRPDRAVPGGGRRTSRCWSSTGSAPSPAGSAAAG